MFNSLIRFFLSSLLTCCLVISYQSQAWGQFDLRTQNSNNLSSLEVIRYGNIEVTWVKSPFNKQALFQIAAPTVIDRSNIESNRLTVEARARNVEALLWLTYSRIRGDVVTKILSLNTADDISKTSAKAIISTLNNRPVIQIKYSQFLPITIASVTQTEVDFYGQTADTIVRFWQKSLQQNIDRIEYLYSARIIQLRFIQAIAILLTAIIASVVLGLIYWWLGRRMSDLRLQYNAGIEACKSATAKMQTEAQSDLNSEANTINEAENSDIITQQAYLQKRLNRQKSCRWISIWLLVSVWYLSIYAITTRLPILMRWSEALVSQPLQLLTVWFLVSLLLEVSKTFIRRSIDAWQDNPYITFGESQRKSLRLATIAKALKGLMNFVFIALGIILTLALFNISTGSILAGGAVIGLAISFGTQSLIKDVVNGCLILIEDRFAVGDVININGMEGFVEEFNLHLTQLRNPEGQLISIPNSAIAEVKNLTRLWSRVDFSIEVAYENDPDRVLEVLDSVSQSIYHSPQWQDKILATPEVLGIDSLSHTGMLVRVWIKTAPLQQWLVGREYRLRVRRAFEENDIVIGRPQWISYSASLKEDKLNKLS